LSSPRRQKVDMNRVRVERRSIPTKASPDWQRAPLAAKIGVEATLRASDTKNASAGFLVPYRPIANEIARMLADSPIRFPEILR
jgi:hypothetical protein